MNKMTIRIKTPDATIYQGEATRLRVSSISENFTLLPRHTPSVEIIDAGELQIVMPDQEEIYIGMHGGILEVSNNHVNILAHEASLTSEKGQAIAEMRRAKQERKAETDKKRIQMIKSEMELYRLLRQANEK